MSLPLTDDAGVVQTISGGVPVCWNAGLGYTANGLLCVTSIASADDVWQWGRRISQQGLLVVTLSSPAGQPFDYNAGWPMDKVTGAIISQTGVPAATDPRVAGIAIGPLGGVYMTEGGWTPLALWPNGAASPGMWIAPLYVDDSFQDSAGTTSLSAIGTVLDTSNPVGLMLDRKGGATSPADPGIHLSQSTSAARPVASGRVNLLTKTEDFADAAWEKADFTFSKNQIGIDGTLSAFTVSDTSAVAYGNIRQNIPNTGATVKTGYYYLLKTTGTPATYPALQYITGAVNSAIIFNTTTGEFVVWAGSTGVFSVVSIGLWWQVVATGVSSEVDTTRLLLYPAVSADGTTASVSITGSCVVCAPQLNLGSTALPYQRVNTASDYDATGFPVATKFDGVDDALASATFAAGTLTSSMDCLIAVRRDSAAAVVAGLYNAVADATKWFGMAESGSGSGCVGSGAGTPTVWVDGVQLTGGTAVTRGTLHTALTAGAFHVLEFRGLDLSTWTDAKCGLYTGYALNGVIGGKGIMLFPSTTDANRDRARTELAASVGLTL